MVEIQFFTRYCELICLAVFSETHNCTWKKFLHQKRSEGANGLSYFCLEFLFICELFISMCVSRKTAQFKVPAYSNENFKMPKF